MELAAVIFGLFLQNLHGDGSARRALADAVRIDEIAFGASAPQTLEDAYRLAGFLRATGRAQEAAALDRQFKAASSK